VAPRRRRRATRPPSRRSRHSFPMGDSSVGASVSAPFGLKTEYDPAGSAATPHQIGSEDRRPHAVRGLRFRRASVSFGLGLVYERAEATLSNAIDFGSRICQLNVALCVTFQPGRRPFGPQKNDGKSKVKGDDTGIGWIVGMHIHPTDNLALGFRTARRSTHDIAGTADFTVPANVSPLLAVGAPGQFVDTAAARADHARPSHHQRHLRHHRQLHPDGRVSQTEWSSLQEVAINFGNPRQQPNPAVEDFVEGHHVLRHRRRVEPQRPVHAARGYATDQSPTNDTDAHPAPARRGPHAGIRSALTWSPSETWESTPVTAHQRSTIRPSTWPSLATSGSRADRQRSTRT
jgi:long-chain fatty acid transport protein